MAKKVYCGVGKTPKKSKKGTMKECAEAGQIRLFGKYKVDENLIKHAKKAKKTKDDRMTVLLQKARMKGRMVALKRKHANEKDAAKKKIISAEYKELVREVRKVNAKLRQFSSSISRSRGRSRSRSRNKKTKKKATKKKAKKRTRSRSR